LLNLFPEHLDYFKTAANYFNAKFNIAQFQSENDHFYWDACPEEKTNFPKFAQQIQNSEFYIKNESIFAKDEKEPILRLEDLLHLKGNHQLKNILPVLDLCRTLHLDEIQTLESIKTFRPLPHRLEFVGKIQDIQFYNDSISTIPEACIAALSALKKVDYLILGGFDRALDYKKLYAFLAHYPLKKVFFIGPAGKRMQEELEPLSAFQKIYIENLHHFESHLKNLITNKGQAICLLSPAAASYDEFKNFEERGQYYRRIIEKFM
jgi:UDP-N-acetylmuramoylalanine--D-glutamate ligase